MKQLNKSKGIALIQVLIIAIVLTMLGIYINQTVRSQLYTVGYMKSAFELNLLLENSEATLLQALLTNKTYKNINDDSPLIQRWNFHGEPFMLDDNTKVTIQDLSSLISLNTINKKMARALFAELGHSGHEVRTFLDSLTDWIDKDDLKRLNGAENDYYHFSRQVGPRNAYLQTLEEVENIKQGRILSKAQWHRYFTTNVSSRFNPLNSPPLILKAFVNYDASYEEVIKLRNEGVLTALDFFLATSIDEDEYISFSAGKKFRVTLEVTEQKIKLSKQFIVELRPRSSSRAITISQLLWNSV
jgi:general secretion pathway protein K